MVLRPRLLKCSPLAVIFKQHLRVKQAFILTVPLLLMTNIVFGQIISQTDKLVPKDFEVIFSLAFDLPQLQQYYHISHDSSRRQVILKDFGKANHNNLLGVTKFSKQVLIMTEDQLKQNKIKNYFVLGDWVCGDNSIRLQLQYIGESLLISYMFKKLKDHWVILNFDLKEE